MSPLQKHKYNFLLLLVLILSIQAESSDFSKLCVFGDSLSSWAVWNANARGQRGNGSNWTYYFCKELEISRDNYQNHAFGGLRSEQIYANVVSYAISQTPDAKTLYSLWGGMNDSGVNIDPMLQSVELLASRGARYILISNLYNNLHKSPAFITAFNHALYNGISHLQNEVNIIMLDAYSFVNEITQNPTSYGFPSQAFFSDGLHFTDQSNRLYSDYASSILAAPEIMNVLPFIPLSTIHLQKNILHSHIYSSINTSWNSFVETWGNDGKWSGKSVIDGTRDGLGFTGGIIHQSHQFQAGASLSLAREDLSWKSAAGEAEISHQILSLYGQYDSPIVQISSVLTIGSHDFESIKRFIALGSFKRTEESSTSGSHQSLDITAKKNFYKKDNFSISGDLGMGFVEISVDGFTEKGTNSTSMFFDEQKFDSLTGNAGVGLKNDFSVYGGILTAFGHFTLLHEFKDEPSAVQAGLKNFPENSFSLPSGETDSTYIQYDLGLRFFLREELSGSFTLSNFDYGDSSNFYWRLGVDIAF